MSVQVPSRKSLMEKITALGSTEHTEIFRILKKYNVPHTQNNNGIFVNITSVPEEILKEVHDFVSYCSLNNKELEDYDKKLNQCKLYQNLDCMLDPREVDIEDNLDTKADIDDNVQTPYVKVCDDKEEIKVVTEDRKVDARAYQRINMDLFDSAETRRTQVPNTKFSMAKKKYSKKTTEQRVSASVLDTMGISELKAESYVNVPTL